MRNVLIASFAILVCFIAASCCHMQPKSAASMQAQCIIETESPNTVVEVMLDGKLIFSGKTHEEKNGNLDKCEFVASPGKHHLVVSGTGHEMWEKQIVLVGGSNKFWAKLKK
jgi:hypothetical protein